MAAVGLDAAANAGILAVQILATGTPGSASSCRSSRTSWPRACGCSRDPPVHAPRDGRHLERGDRFRLFVEVEVAVVRARARRGLVPAADLAVIEEAPAPSPERVHQLDAELHHDVIAFLTAYGGDRRGRPARPLRHDLLRPARHHPGPAAHPGLRPARPAAGPPGRDHRDRALEHRDTLCLGRTHGVAAEPTTFGLKLAGHAFAFDRDRRRLAAARDAVAVGTVSGAVGTYANLPAEIEAEVLDELGLRPEPAPTQVVARDRHAELLATLAVAGADVERLAVEVRHLQRTEVREAEEPFAEGQKGSSAMPTSATRSWPSASPGWHGCCAATPPPAWRTSPSGTSATSPTRPWSGSCCPTPAACSTTPWSGPTG